MADLIFLPSRRRPTVQQLAESLVHFEFFESVEEIPEGLPDFMMQLMTIGDVLYRRLTIHGQGLSFSKSDIEED